jgi:hypothetical protein
MTLRDAIRAIYAEVSAPAWAAPNLDGLADVLRDLSWLPEGAVFITRPALDDVAADDAERLMSVLLQAVAETTDGPRPVRVVESETDLE